MCILLFRVCLRVCVCVYESKYLIVHHQHQWQQLHVVSLCLLVTDTDTHTRIQESSKSSAVCLLSSAATSHHCKITPVRMRQMARTMRKLRAENAKNVHGMGYGKEWRWDAPSCAKYEWTIIFGCCWLPKVMSNKVVRKCKLLNWSTKRFGSSGNTTPPVITIVFFPALFYFVWLES